MRCRCRTSNRSRGPRTCGLRTLGLRGLLSLWLATCAPAQAGTGDAATEDEGVLASTRRSVRSATEWLARGVDSWFGDRPFSEGGGLRDGYLSLYLQTRQGEKADASVRFSANVDLPNADRYAYLFLGRDDRREIVADKPDALSRQQLLLKQGTAEPVFFAGVGVALLDAIDFRLGLRGGLKPYAQARYEQTWQPGAADLINFRETLFWSVDDQFGSTTVVSYSHAFSRTLGGRWLNSATITQQSRKFEWSSIFGAYQSFGDQRLLSLEMIFSGVQGSEVPVSDTGVQVKWEQPIHEDWLLGEVIVGHFWPRDDPLGARRKEWALGGSLKMRF